MKDTPTKTMADDIRKQLPNVVDAEIQVLSIMMEKDPDGLYAMKAFDRLSPEAFYRPGHKGLAQWIQGQRAAGSPCDVISLITAMSASQGIAEIFTKTFGETAQSDLVTIAHTAVTVAHFDWQVDQIKEAWVKRKGIEACTQAIDDFYKGETTANMLLANAQDQLSAITFDFETVREEADVAQEALQDIEKSIVSPTALGFTTGFDVLDSAMSLKPGELVTIAARTSVGKTAFAAQLMDHLANTHKGLYITQEMRSAALFKRLISKDINYNVDKLQAKDGALIGAVTNSVGRRQQRNALYMRDTETMTIPMIETMVRVYAARGCKFFCIDYLQLMKAPKSSERLERRHQIAEITGRLKQMAMKLGIVVILVSQIARLEDDERPELRHLSESKSIEDDSDKVILLFRALGSRQAEAKVAKDRSGPTTPWVDLGFEPETTSFKDLPRA